MTKLIWADSGGRQDAARIESCRNFVAYATKFCPVNGPFIFLQPIESVTRRCGQSEFGFPVCDLGTLRDLALQVRAKRFGNLQHEYGIRNSFQTTDLRSSTLVKMGRDPDGSGASSERRHSLCRSQRRSD